jgi:glutathione-regulated potassium-efflux system protein KefB
MAYDLVASVVAVAGMVLAGRYLLTPMFQIIARTGAREVMIAAALFVVIGAAAIMEMVGLSMGMGALLAGLMLSESSYRHELEADIEPFRGLFLALFFMAVGMSLDLSVVAAEWGLLIAMLVAFTIAKGAVVYAVARLFGGSSHQALHRTSMFLQGGEFAFVLYAAATAGGVIDQRENALFTTVVIFSMALTPLLMIAADRLLRSETSMEGVEAARDLSGKVLIIGFGRFGQIASQLLLAKGVNLSVIDMSPDRIREAERFGFKVFFGDGTRLDTLHHSGAGSAEALLICINDPKAALQIVELAQHEFPQARILVRSYDRGHAVDLIRAGVDYQIRETVESAYMMGAEGLRALGYAELDVEEAAEDVRRRDNERLSEQVQGDVMSGLGHLHVRPAPEPLSPVPAKQ